MEKKFNVAGRKFDLAELMVYGGTVLFFVCSFLTFVGVGQHGDYYFEDYNYITNGGIIAIILMLVACACVYLKFEKYAIPASVVSLCYTIYQMLFGVIERDEFRHTRMGSYVELVLAVVIVLGTYLVYKNRLNRQ